MIITIDGSIATGKSTIAKKLAEDIGYIFFDTGAMYRCLTYFVLKNKGDVNNTEQVQKILKEFRFNIKIKPEGRIYLVDGEDVTKAIRGEEVTAHVSKVSAIASVREKLVALQREMAEGVNAVFEGRDMGTVVFPHANIKVFLTGDPQVRAKRRFEELKAKFPNETQNLTVEKVLEDINKRDTYDSTREVSPLQQAKDSLVIDTTNLTVDEIVLRILEHKDTMKTRPNPA